MTKTSMTEEMSGGSDVEVDTRVVITILLSGFGPTDSRGVDLRPRITLFAFGFDLISSCRT